MKRRTLDLLLTGVGAVLTVGLLVAGGLMMWGANFASSSVKSQLAQQHITFPTKESGALSSPEIGPYLDKYAGMPMTTGDQARAYADHFIAVHLNGISGGKTYSELSAQAMANPSDKALADKVETVFKGTTLRGLLLEAYAFSMFGTLAMVGGLVALALGLVMLILTVLGFMHYRRVDADLEFPAPRAEKDLVNA